MKPGRVIFVNRFYWPEEPATAQLLTDLATALVSRGHSVSIVTSRPKDPQVPRRETKDGVIIERIRSTRFGRASGLGRALDLLTFNAAAFWRLLCSASADDTVVAMTDPPLLGVIAWFATSARQSRLLHWVQDIYPELAAELTGHRALLLLRPLRDASWRHACACVAPGEQMAATVRTSAGNRTRVVVSPNWAPTGIATASHDTVTATRARWQLDGKFVAMYSGNLGRVHDLEPILEVAEKLRTAPDIAFVFVGNGARRESLEESASRRGLTNIHFFPAQPRQLLGASLRVGDVHFISLQPGADRWVYPSKLYGVVAVDRPVIFLGSQESEVARTIRSAGLGQTFDSSDSAGVARALLELQRANGLLQQRSAVRGTFGEGGLEQAVDTWCRLLGPELAAPTGAR